MSYPAIRIYQRIQTISHDNALEHKRVEVSHRESKVDTGTHLRDLNPHYQGAYLKCHPDIVTVLRKS